MGINRSITDGSLLTQSLPVCQYLESEIRRRDGFFPREEVARGFQGSPMTTAAVTDRSEDSQEAFSILAVEEDFVVGIESHNISGLDIRDPQRSGHGLAHAIEKAIKQDLDL